MEPMVQVLEFVAKKYEEDNWKKPMDKKQILNSMMRHIMANALFYSFHSRSNDSK